MCRYASQARCTVNSSTEQIVRLFYIGPPLSQVTLAGTPDDFAMLREELAALSADAPLAIHDLAVVECALPLSVTAELAGRERIDLR